ncbi:MAG TPA: hypothetical protein VFZ14_10945 [Burkholderiales bacterium]|nr:hypothetical protein [Burkholderiales bacterium]
MTTADERLARLSGRTSREAWLRLQRMRDHPELTAVLGYLELIEGMVLDSHVEQAVRRFAGSAEDPS